MADVCSPGTVHSRPLNADPGWAHQLLALAATSNRLFPIETVVKFAHGGRRRYWLDSGPELLPYRTADEPVHVDLDLVVEIEFPRDPPIDRSDELGY